MLYIKRTPHPPKKLDKNYKRKHVEIRNNRREKMPTQNQGFAFF